MASYDSLDDIILKLQQADLSCNEESILHIPKEEFDFRNQAYINNSYGKVFF